MFEQEITVFRFSQGLTVRMAEAVPDERFADQPIPGVTMNHAAWVVGHLGLTADFIGRLIGADPVAPAAWMDLFMPGTQPLPDRGRYPSKQELLDGLTRSEQALPDILGRASQAWLDQPPEMEGFIKMGLTTNRDVVAGLLTAHHGYHTGQLSAWRRAMGFPSVFAKRTTA